MATGLISVPLTVRYLGKERYGLWLTALSVLSVLTVIEAGFVPSLKNRLAEAFGRGDKEDFARFVSASLFASALIVLVAGMFLPVVMVVPWQHLFKLTDANAARESLPLMMVLVMVVIAAFATSFIEAIYAARGQISTILVFQLIASVIGLMLLMLAIHFRATLPALAAITGAPTPAGRVLLLYSLYRRYPDMFLIRLRPAIAGLRTVLPASIEFAALRVTDVLVSSTPNIIVVRLLGVAAVATLSIGQRLASVPLMCVGAMMPVFWPAFTIARARGEHSWLARKFAIAGSATGISLVAYALGLFIAGPAVIAWWLGGRIIVPRNVLGILAVWLIFQGLWYWLSTLLNSVGDIRFQAGWNLVQFAVLAGVGIPLTAALGLPGLVFAMALGVATAAVIPMGIRAHRYLTVRENGSGVCAGDLGHATQAASEVPAE
jgi:O-antigen/teichoic acid export membrane protein